MEAKSMPDSGEMSQAILDFLTQNIPILYNLGQDELKIIGRYLNYIEVKPEETLFEEGDRGAYICFVVDGSLEVLKKSESGEGSILMASLSRGHSIGEMAVIDDLPRSATVKGLTKTKLVTLSKDNFDYILADHPDIGVKILKGIARLVSLNLRKTSSTLVDHMLPLI